MPVQTDHLADEIKYLTASVVSLKTDTAAFRGSVESQLGTVRWIGTFFAGILATLVLSAVGLSWSASALNSEVKQLSAKSDEQRAELKQLAVDVKEQSRRFDKIDRQLELITHRLDQITPPKGK